jgi:hypothetical protein
VRAARKGADVAVDDLLLEGGIPLGARGYGSSREVADDRLVEEQLRLSGHV